MRRPRFGSVLAAVAVATAGLIPIFASPASAANNCGPGTGSGGPVNTSAGSQYPVGPGALAELKIDCHVDAAVNPPADNIILHDARNGIWHHGAARTVAGTVTGTAGSRVLVLSVANSITALDLSRPISYRCQTGGAFIAGITSTTVIKISKPSKAGCSVGATTTVIVEHSTNRVLHDIDCPNTGAGGVAVLTSTVLTTTGVVGPSDQFSAADVGKSVTGGPFGGAGGGTGGGSGPTGVWRIVSVSGITATLNAAAPTACTDAEPTPGPAGVQDVITIGGQTYGVASDVPTFKALWPSNPMTIELSNTPAVSGVENSGTGFTCTVVSGFARIALGTAAAGKIPSFSAAYTKMQVILRGSGAPPPPTTVTGFVSPSLVLAATTCPAGITATAGSATIGVPNATAPVNGSPMMELNAELNLNPSLVKTQDDCTRNTIEGFEVVGMWNNPGAYAAGTVAVPVSTGQIVFPTAVVSFAGNIVPRKGATNNGDSQVTSSHFDFVFPSLPTSAAVCLTPPTIGTPSNPTQLALAFASVTLSGDINGNGPYTQTGAGNPQDATVRALDQRFSQTFNGKYELKLGASPVASGATFSCAIPASTVVPGLTCGDG